MAHSKQLRTLEEEKRRLARIRNARAEIYLIYLNRMEAAAKNNNTERYEFFLEKIQDMEPYSQEVKAKAKEINRQISEITGQEVFISDTCDI